MMAVVDKVEQVHEQQALRKAKPDDSTVCTHANTVFSTRAWFADSVKTRQEKVQDQLRECRRGLRQRHMLRCDVRRMRARKIHAKERQTLHVHREARDTTQHNTDM